MALPRDLWLPAWSHFATKLLQQEPSDAPLPGSPTASLRPFLAGGASGRPASTALRLTPALRCQAPLPPPAAACCCPCSCLLVPWQGWGCSGCCSGELLSGASGMASSPSGYVNDGQRGVHDLFCYSARLAQHAIASAGRQMEEPQWYCLPHDNQSFPKTEAVQQAAHLPVAMRSSFGLP